MKKDKKEILAELEIDSLAYEGLAVARKEGKVYFIKGAVPLDIVIARIHKSKKNYAEGIVKEIIEPSPNRIEPECEYFGTCGGCSWQNINYSEQLHWKAIHVKDAFERIGKFINPKLLEIIGSERPFHYRNKMEFSFGGSRWLREDEINSEDEIINKNFGLGLHLPGRFDKILDLAYCRIQQTYSDDILNSVRDKALELGLTAYNPRTRSGFLRSLIIRYSLRDDSFMVNLITWEAVSDVEKEFLQWLKQEFYSKFDKVTSLVHAVNISLNPVTIERFEILKGNQYLTERIIDVDYHISPFSFFQTNSHQLDKFISKIIETADIQSNDIVWDLYCGAGSITLPASKKCREIYGIELSKDTINDANHNKQFNNIDNAHFYADDLHRKNIPELLNTLPKPDIIILDPPRAGLHNNLINHLLQIETPKIVYVSCNPATQARDCEILSSKYELMSVQPFDMFPQTYHIETIALLKIKE